MNIFLCSMNGSRVVKMPHSIVGKTALKSEDLCLRPTSYKLCYLAIILNLSEPHLYNRSSYATSLGCCEDQMRLCVYKYIINYKAPYKCCLI